MRVKMVLGFNAGVNAGNNAGIDITGVPLRVFCGGKVCLYGSELSSLREAPRQARTNSEVAA